MRNRLSTIWAILPASALLSVPSAFPSAARAHPQDSQEQQEQSVADAARRSREQKKSAAKQSKIISNEDLDLEYYKPGQEGYNFGAPSGSSTAAPSTVAVAADSADQSAASTNKDSQPKSKESEEAAAQDEEIKNLKEQIAHAEDQLKWQQRDFALNQDTVYSNPNYTDFKTGKAKLDSEQQQINERQQEIEGLKARLAELEERQGRRKQAAPSENAPPGR
jgi:hypothetical protein